jgi:Kelch motif protein
VASTKGGAVVAGGLLNGDVSASGSYRIRLSDGQVTALPGLVVPVHDAASVRNGAGAPVVIGGGNSTEQAAVQALVHGHRWRVVSQLTAPRADLTAVSVANRIVVVGGYDGVREAVRTLVSSGGLDFRPLGRLIVPVRYPSVVRWRGDVLVLGGERHGHMVKAVQQIQIPSGRCRVVGRLRFPVGHAAAVAIGGRILLMGGRTTEDSVTSSMEWFDPRNGTVRPAGHLPYPLADTGLASTGRGAYLLGGETPKLTNRVVKVRAR